MSQNSEKSAMDGVDPKLLMEAMMGEMRRLMRQELGEVHERLDRMEDSRQESPQYHNRRRERHEQRNVEDGSGKSEGDVEQGSVGSHRRNAQIGEFGIEKITTLMA